MQKSTMKIISSIALLLCLNNVFLMAGPPDPPVGKVWILNHEMSDEFDANSPDIDKWKVFDKSDSWGRSASFDKRTLEAYKDPNSDNYYLSMNPMWYYEDERFARGNGEDYYFAGGGMDTRVLQTYGYFEVRVKPSDFPMGSGVFMNSRTTTSDDCNTKYATELDIIENMGYTGPFNEYGDGSFNNYQHVNSHAKPFSDESGSCEQLPYESENSNVDAHKLAEPLGWNTVGMWWKDEKTAMFYNDNSYFGTITPARDFYLPMPVIIVMETYGWGSDENNATNPKPEEWMFENDFRTKEQRAVMYDWVRVWKLVDIDAAEFNDEKDNIKALEENVTTYPSSSLSSTIIYSASANRTVVAKVYDSSDAQLAENSFDVEKGVKSIFAEFDLELEIADGYKIVYEIKDGDTVLATFTSIVNIVEKPLEKKLWRDGIPTSLQPGETSYTIDVKYETDEDCKINIEMRKPDGSWLGGGSVNVGAGNNVATVNVTTSSATTKANNYFYKVYMHRKGYDWQDPLAVSISPNIYFNVEDAIEPAIQILSVPTQIEIDATEVKVEFEYETYENGRLNIELIDNNNTVVASEIRTERIGSRSLSRTIDITKELVPSDDYKIAVIFSPEKGSFDDLKDTVYHITVKSQAVGIEELKARNKNLIVYPNPVASRLKIELAENTKDITRVEVLGVNGRLIKVIPIAKGEELPFIDVEGLSSGVYILKLTTEDQVYATRFIKSE
nr:T9SS type A sorting domain-containing protein [uncultured Marinifilum sp.]